MFPYAYRRYKHSQHVSILPNNAQDPLAVALLAAIAVTSLRTVSLVRARQCDVPTCPLGYKYRSSYILVVSLFIKNNLLTNYNF